jgi:hypothetical protein
MNYRNRVQKCFQNAGWKIPFLRERVTIESQKQKKG